MQIKVLHTARREEMREREALTGVSANVVCPTLFFFVSYLPITLYFTINTHMHNQSITIMYYVCMSVSMYVCSMSGVFDGRQIQVI